MTLPKLLEIEIETGFIACFRLPQSVEQQVRDLRHRRNDGHHGTQSALLRADLSGDANTFGGAHARAAELHDKQIVQRAISFPSCLACGAMRSRIMRSRASSASSSVSPLVSMWIASGACLSGDSPRVRSRWSRSAISSATA